MDLLIAVYDCAKRFPDDERYALTDQIRRAAVSIPSNIAEGHGRESARSYLHYCLTAHGSLREVETQIEAASRLGYVDDEARAELRQRCVDVGRPLRGRIGYLRKHPGARGVHETDEPTPYIVDE